MQVEQGTKHPEASPWHRFTQMFTVVIGFPKEISNKGYQTYQRIEHPYERKRKYIKIDFQ